MEEIKKYASLQNLQTFKENLDNKFATKTHSHTIDEIVDYVVDVELSSTSVNPVQNKVLDAEFNAIEEAMGALELAIDEIAAYVLNINYNTLAFDTAEIVINTSSSSGSNATTPILGKAILGQMILA